MTMDELASRFGGVFTALITPFKDGEVDTVAYDALVERQLEAGVAGLVPVGTTGEAATLADDEADALIARTARLAGGRALVMAGAGANDTKKTVEKVKRAEAAGADAVLIVTPYYNKPTQAGLIAHYSMAAAATSLPVMLYSVPGSLRGRDRTRDLRGSDGEACQHHRHQGSRWIGEQGHAAARCLRRPVHHSLR
jgi:4-hydroxy-tetrahydrodipicolinate synthase